MPEIIISSKQPLFGLDFPELWRYRELFWTLAWRNILLHYKQTAIGIVWALLRPLLTMVVFTVIFGRLAGLPSGDIPYPLLVFAATLPWQFFANSLTSSTESVVSHAGMITKVYFPRMIIPASAVISGIMDFLISLSVLAGMMAWYGVMPGIRVLLLPAFFLLAFACSFGAGLWLSALNVRFRDARHIVPFLVQLGLYVSPVGFSSSLIPGNWQLLYSINPMVGVIEGFRWCLLGQTMNLNWTGFALSLVITLIILVTGLLFFSRMERNFADII